LNNSKANVAKCTSKQKNYNNVFNDLISFNKVGAGIRRAQRLSMSSNVSRYNKARNIGKHELIQGNISSYNGRVNNNNFGISVWRFNLNKRYRTRKLKNSLLNSKVSLLQNRKSLFEQNVEKRKVGSLMLKNRLNVFNNSRYAMFLTKGSLNK